MNRLTKWITGLGRKQKTTAISEGTEVQMKVEEGRQGTDDFFIVYVNEFAAPHHYFLSVYGCRYKEVKFATDALIKQIYLQRQRRKYKLKKV